SLDDVALCGVELNGTRRRTQQVPVRCDLGQHRNAVGSRLRANQCCNQHGQRADHAGRCDHNPAVPASADSLADIRTLEKWLRARRVRALIAAALAVSLLLGGAFLIVSRLRPPPSDALDHPVNPVTDDETATQVVEPAKQIVTVAGLQTASAGYLLMSCKNQNDPPYQ